jgi:hypothetical protein
VNKIIQLRLSVAFLGERAQCAWWDTAFLNPLGVRYLSLVFPKTVGLASLGASFEAACQLHDDRIGRGRVAHLFRLPEDIELGLRKEVLKIRPEQILTTCSVDSAYRVIASIADGFPAMSAIGPVQIGAFQEIKLEAAIQGAAATYLSGFQSQTPVFPYFG